MPEHRRRVVQAARGWGRFVEEKLDTKDISEHHQRGRVWKLQMEKKTIVR